eukprot:scaffold5717_cov112-Isochrysis_galbana.AAC.1
MGKDGGGEGECPDGQRTEVSRRVAAIQVSSKPPHPRMSVGAQVRKVMSGASLPNTPSRKGW